MQSIIQLAFLNFINDIDNILIIAALLRKHYYEQFPKALFIVKVSAVVMLTASRTLFVAAIQVVKNLPGLHLVTGLIVLWIGVRLAVTTGPDEEARLHLWAGKRKTPPIPIYRMLLIILFTDFVISLDTVFLTAQLSKSLLEAVFGLSFSLVIVFSLLPILTNMIDLFYWLQIIAGGILAQVSVHAMAKEPFILDALHRLQQYMEDMNADNLVQMLAIDVAIIVVLLGIIRLMKVKAKR